MNAATLELTALDGVHLAAALRCGIYQLFSRSEHINKINVFPVPDGDTGTNMAMTLAAVLQTLDRGEEHHAGKLLVRCADAALDGARGNSGAILAQFLLGLADRAGHLAHLSTDDFSSATTGGAAYAREAMSQPREGTLLTVLAEFAREVRRFVDARAGRDFAALFAAALTRARASLEATRAQLEELRAANVVDAGAQGFVELVDGMERYLRTGDVGKPVASLHDLEEHLPAGAVRIDQRYCTECLITGEALVQRRVRERLSALGSSLVVGGTQRKVRIHIHADDPEAVFDAAREFGTVSAEKADDMLRQAEAAHHARTRQVAVVMDSAADVPESLLETLELHMVPVRVHFGSRSYLDKVSLSAAEFYRELATNPEHPKTSQPPPGDFRRIYDFLSTHYEGVVSISLSSQVSGTYNAACTAAERVPGGRVAVLDTRNVSLGQGLIAMSAAECAQRGGTLEQVVAAARDAAERTSTFALLARLDYAVRGGRIPRAVAVLANLLRFAPVLSSRRDGRVAPVSVIVGRFRLRSRFARFVARRTRSTARYRVLVGHADAEEEGQRLLEEICAAVAQVESSHVLPLGTALGAHGGPGMLVVGIQELR